MRSKPLVLVLRGLAASTLLCASPALAQDSSAVFHKAYYLEHEEGRLEQALALYEKVAKSRGGDAELRALAADRAAGIVEEFAASDMARLVPEDTIFYAQMDRPGQQFSMLLDQLGLLGEAHAIAEDRIAISPLLIEHALGLRGAAVAVTELGQDGQPSGVLLLHPGSHDGLRGLIDTALPAVGQRVDSIGGFPVWSIEGEAFVCLTRRLVVASDDPSQVAAVVKRLSNKKHSSLASDPRFAGAMGEHGAGLLSFYLNADPLKPMIHMMLEQEIGNDPEAMMVMNLLDIDSFESLSGRIGVDDEGLGLNLALELSEGHRNLAFNLMRRPTVTHETMELVPEGAAFFLATAFNPEADIAPIARDGIDQPVVSALDFGRELFGNVVDVAVFGMPEATGGGLPDVNVVVRVNDAERSRALWGLCLGLACQATGSESPVVEQLGGADVTRYTIENVPFYLASKGDRMVLSPNRSSIERALGGGYGRSIKKDAVLGAALAALDDSPTFLLAACPGRMADMAEPFMSSGDRAEMRPIADLLDETSMMLISQHSDTRLALAARVENIPDVSGLVGQALAQQRGAWGPHRGSDVLEVVSDDGAWSALPASAKSSGHQKKTPKKQSGYKGTDMLSLRKTFEDHVERGDRAAAIGKVQRMLASVEDAKELNNLAWALLTEKRYKGEYDEAARTLSVRSNELSDHGNWYYLDTLALAEFRAGNYEAAIQWQEKVLELAGHDGDQRPELTESLERYRRAQADAAGESVVVR